MPNSSVSLETATSFAAFSLAHMCVSVALLVGTQKTTQDLSSSYFYHGFEFVFVSDLGFSDFLHNQCEEFERT